MPDFKVDLYQSYMHRAHTETFNLEAKDEDEANKKAQALIKDKGIEGDTCDFEISEIVPAELATEPDPTAEEAFPGLADEEAVGTAEPPSDGNSQPVQSPLNVHRDEAEKQPEEVADPRGVMPPGTTGSVD